MLAKFVSPNNWKIPLTKPAKAKAKTAGTSARLGPKSKKKEFSLDNDIDLDMLDDEQMSQEEPNNKENVSVIIVGYTCMCVCTRVRKKSDLFDLNRIF